MLLPPEMHAVTSFAFNESRTALSFTGLKYIFMITAAVKFAARHDKNTISPAFMSPYIPMPTIPITNAGPLL